MNTYFQSIPKSVVAPKGFKASGVFCDIKRLGTGKGSSKGKKRDLAISASDAPCVAAGVFTANQVKAAPVKLCLERIGSARARAVVVNSGNANACTGDTGRRDAEAMAHLTADALSAPKEEVLVCSTGRIGAPLPMPNVRKGIRAAAAALDNRAASASNAAEAFMTSDTVKKQAAVELTIGGRPVKIGAVAKGAGMIEPRMTRTGVRPQALHATMLCVATTDAAIAPKALSRALQTAVDQSFNRVTIDGDMSTNDTVLALANGAAGNPRLAGPRSRDWNAFADGLNHVFLTLAKMMARDGEGVSRVVTISVRGARSDAEADAAARAVGNSQLVKTSWCGGDPNWGRIMDALGYSAARVDENKVDIGYAASGAEATKSALKAGRPSRVALASLAKIVAAPEFDLHINLNLGSGSAILYASDLTEEYVDFNKGE